MVRISRNNLSASLQAYLDSLGSPVGEIIGNADTYAHLPQTNTDVGTTGLSIQDGTSQIADGDIIIVSDATSEAEGRVNALYKATTTASAGAAVTWTFLAALNATGGSSTPASTRQLVVSTLVTEAVAGNTQVAQNVKDAFDANPGAVEVFVNGLLEPGFTINASRKLVLTGYPATGWSESDTVTVFAYLTAA